MLIAHVWNSGTGELERCTYPDGDHAVPEGQLCLFEVREQHQARVVDQCVDTTVAGNGKLNDALASANSFEILITSSSGASGGVDLRDDRVRDSWVEAATVLCDTRIVDDDRAASRRNQACIRRPKTTACSSNDDNLT